ncbi:MAG: M14 family zinc carboxypeptidase [Deltaproteobacteria bacterium]
MNCIRGVLVFGLLSSLCVAATPPSGKYKTIYEQMVSLETQNPTIAKVFSIGTNDDGVEMYALRISTQPQAIDKSKIGQFLVATHHGNEGGSTLLAVEFMKDLLRRYQSDELWRGNLNQTEWTILPVLNISGYNANQRHEHGQDPNRDYPGPCTPSGFGKLKSIRNLIAFLESRPFAGSVTAHGYVGNFTYPWGFYTDNNKTQDENRYREIFRKVADVNGYSYGNSGDAIYPANGCYEDFVYWKHGSWSLLVELLNGSQKDVNETVPAISQFFDLIDSTPSSKNQFEANCTRHRGPDLRNE